MRNSFEKEIPVFFFTCGVHTTTAYRRLNYFLIPHPSWNYSHLVASHFSASRFDYAFVFFFFSQGSGRISLPPASYNRGTLKWPTFGKNTSLHTRGIRPKLFQVLQKGVNMSKIRVFVYVPGLIWCNLKKLFVRCGNTFQLGFSFWTEVLHGNLRQEDWITWNIVSFLVCLFGFAFTRSNK